MMNQALSIKEKIQSIVRENLTRLIDIRRHLHQYPELSFQEFETMKFVSSKLDEIEVDHTPEFAKTGIVGVIGNQKGRCIGLRADMDALPMYEKTEKEYASKNEGVMHACGHDVHTTCLIGAAMALKQIENELNGQIKLVFQPAEERMPGGAQAMIEAGLLRDEPKPELMLGLHVHPPLEVGKLGFKPGMFMASADEITIKIRGKGGHAAVPREFVDPVSTSASFIMQVQQVVSRKSDPAIPTVISFGHIETKGGAFNIIPEEVVLQGTLRTMDETWRLEAQQLIRNCAQHIAQSMGCEAEVEILHGYPCLINDEALTAKTKALCSSLLDENDVVDLPFRMSAEDFARYAQEIPSVFYRLGVRNDEKGITAPVHSPYFDVDEECIFYGATSMAYMAYELLEEKH